MTFKLQIKKPIPIIKVTFVLTVITVICYDFYLTKTNPDINSIAIPFAFIALTGVALFVESIFFAIIFYRHIASTRRILIPVFLLTSMIPIYFIYNWYSDRPVKIPEPGLLNVSFAKYQTDSKLIIDNYLQTAIDDNNIDEYRDTIQTASIDTIFYSLDKTRFFAIIIAVAKDKGKVKYCANYRIGRLVSDKWELGKPKGNMWISCFQSVDILKKELRQYYYKSYSINKSSDKPEIWNDNYIFDFSSPTK